MKHLHTQHLVATIVTVALALTQMTAQTMHRTGRLEGYRAIREDGQRAARALGTAVEIYDWEGDSILAQINGPRMDGQIDALTFAGKKLYAVCSDGRETFELYTLDDTTLRWHKEPVTIDDLWHPHDETRNVWCEYLAEANCLMIQVRTAFSPDWGKTTVRRCIVDLTRHLIRAGSNEGFPTFSRSPDGSYYHFGSSYLASRDSSANLELHVEVQTVDAATLRVMATDTMHPTQRDGWFDASPVSLGCRQIVAYGSGISRPNAEAHAQTAIDRSMALVCIARPSTIVCVDYDYQIHIRTYGVGIVDAIVDDFIRGGQPAKRATYDRASETVLIYCFDHICNWCWPLVYRYKVESTGDKPDVVVALQSADSTKVLDSIGIQVLPFTRSEPEQMQAVFADSIYD